jgi:curved DNA-binding protein CbpA
MDDRDDPYRVLQVDPRADAVVVTAAFRALARRYHPDGEAPDSGRMASINRAYALLRDPEARRRHDAIRSSTSRAAVPMGDRRGPSVVPSPTIDRSDPGTKLDFGRFAGWTITEVARHDPDYLRWLSRHSAGIRFRAAIARALPAESELGRRANSVA